jgi:hypothetical protein
MAFVTPPKEISYLDWIQFVQKLNLGDTSQPGKNEIRMFYESESDQYLLKVWNGTEWDIAGKIISPLEITTTEENAEFIVNRTDGAKAKFSAGLNYVFSGSITPSDYRLLVSNSPQMVITTDGFVGIGTTTPTAKLDVNGEVKISGHTVWHSGNDGAGSGLDADKIHGMEIEIGSAAGSLNGQWNAFSEAFTPTAPIVCVTPTSIGTGAPYLSSITTTGFTLVTPMQNGFCQYHAIGPR